ncbi:MAG: Ig-like domain-containing protein, partial [Chloroflexota bacterium]
MKKWSKAYTLIIVLLFVQAIVSCGFGPQSGEDEQSTGEQPSFDEQLTQVANGELQLEEIATVDPTITPLPLPAQTAEPTDEPVSEATILTDLINTGEPAPRLIGRNPAGTDTLGLDEPLELYFDQPMDPDKTAAAFQFFSADGEPIAGSVDWPQPRILRFTPEQVLTTGSQYSILLADTAISASGMTLVEAVSLDLFTIGDIEVSSVSPANGVTEVASDSAVTVIFSRPVVPLVNAAAQDELPSPVSITPETPGTGEWINTSVYIWRPSVPLAGKGTYQATVLAEVVNGVSASGAQLAEDFRWSFTIAAPTISNLTLPGLARYVGDSYSDYPPQQPLLLTFNQPMDEATTRNAVSLVREDGAAVPLELGWNDIRTAVTITPTQALSFDSRYTFTVQDTAQSEAGGQLRFGEVFRINTVGLPGISETQPADGATQNDFSSGFSILFDTEMDPDSLDEKVIIEPPITGDPNGQYNRWRRSITFWGLSPATDYTVTILPGMTDPYGNELTETQTFTFRTANRDPFVALEMNFPFALYRYNGSSAAWVRNINVSDFQMNVYELTDFTAFFEMVNRYETNVYGGSEDTLVQVSTGTGEPESNKTNYAQFELRDSNGNMHPPGFYYVSLNSPEVDFRRGTHDDARPIIIANANLTLKTTHDEAFAWLTSLDSAEPIAGQEVVLYDESFNIISSAFTDSNGIASMTGLELDTG